jgi:hypothetical protein
MIRLSFSIEELRGYPFTIHGQQFTMHGRQRRDVIMHYSWAGLPL